jgi:putative transposase
MKVSERRICRVFGQHRSTQRKLPEGRADEESLVADMIELARRYGRYGYRRIAALLREAWLARQRQAGRSAMAARGAESSSRNNRRRAGSG